MKKLVLTTNICAKSFLLTSFLPLLAGLLFASGAAAQERVPGTMPLSLDQSAVFPRQVQQQQEDDELAPFYSESGLISLSVDGLGTDDGDGGVIQVDKPAGATVRQAFLLAATTPLGEVLDDGDVTLEGTPISWDERVTIAFGFGEGESGYADVTSLVQPVVDAAPAGLVDFQVTEPNDPDGIGGIDGEIIAVVFDDPNQEETQTVVLAFGAQDPAGDNFAIQLAEPFDEAAQNIRFSLGISFSLQDNQFSIVDVNGERLTSAAGGQDDCEALGTDSCGDGTLLTVGGIGDSEDNPPDPNAGPDGDPRADDELYTLDPFINDGDTQVDVFTQNPSNDDNIFFAAFAIEGAVAIVGEDVLLAPSTDTSAVGTEHTLTATVQDAAGNPVEGAGVDFEVTSGPNAGLTGTAATNANGEASFSYSSDEAGTDVIVASFTGSGGETITSNEVTKVWTAEEEEIATIAFEDQTSADGTAVTVASVFLPEGGYVAIHDSTLLASDALGSVIGVSGYFEAGAQEDVEVTLFAGVPGLDVPDDTALATGQTLVARPHQETSGNEQYDFLTSEGSADGPYLDEEGAPVVDAAFVRLESAPPADPTPPVCSPIDIERDERGQLAAVQTSATDSESGIASVTFTTLDNLEGFLDGNGPFAEGDTESFDPAATETVAIRGERIDFATGGAILTTVTNGEGLTAQCDPVVEQLDAAVPQQFALQGNAPNPFSEQTTIAFSLAEPVEVTLEVYDVLGRRVRTLLSGEKLEARSYRLEWDGRSRSGQALAPGMYVVRLRAGSFDASSRAVLVR